MTGLSSEIEEIILATHQVVQAVLVSHIADIDSNLIRNIMNIVQMAAIVRLQAHIDQGDIGTVAHQPAGEVGADEAKAARY